MYTKLVLYSTSDAKLSKGADVDGEKSYKISSIIRHFNEHYISQLSMLIVLSICFSVRVFALAQRYKICFLQINKTEKFYRPTLFSKRA